jgi:hypothetical protein
MFFFFLEVLVYIYIYYILLRVVSSLGRTLTIFDSLEVMLSQLKVWREYCQFDDSLRGVCELFHFLLLLKITNRAFEK